MTPCRRFGNNRIIMSNPARERLSPVSIPPPPSLRFSEAPENAPEEPQCSAKFEAISDNQLSLSGRTHMLSAGVYAFFSSQDLAVPFAGSAVKKHRRDLYRGERSLWKSLPPGSATWAEARSGESRISRRLRRTLITITAHQTVYSSSVRADFSADY